MLLWKYLYIGLLGKDHATLEKPSVCAAFIYLLVLITGTWCSSTSAGWGFGSIGKVQALPCAKNLFSQYGVGLGRHDSASHQQACPISAELPEFFQRQEGGITEWHLQPLSCYLNCSIWDHFSIGYTTSPEMGMALWHTSHDNHADVPPRNQPLVGPCLSTGWGALRISVPACCHDRCLQDGLGRYMQWAGSLRVLGRASTALAHQLPGVAGSASSFAVVPAAAAWQAHVGPHGQHCGCFIRQQSGRSTITSHVATRPPSPPL